MLTFRVHYIGIIAVEPCRSCSGTGGVGIEDTVCGRCEGSGENVFDVTWIVTLVHNLARAGALYRAFALGGKRARWVHDYFEGWYDDESEAPWAHGEGRAAP